MSEPVKIRGTFEITVADGVPNMQCGVYVDNTVYKVNKSFLDDLNGVMLGLKDELGNAINDHAFPDKQRHTMVAHLLTGTLFRKFGPGGNLASGEATVHIQAWLQRKGLGALLVKVKNRGKVSLVQALMELPEAREPYGDVLDRLGCADDPPEIKPKLKSRMPDYGSN